MFAWHLWSWGLIAERLTAMWPFVDPWLPFRGQDSGWVTVGALWLPADQANAVMRHGPNQNMLDGEEEWLCQQVVDKGTTQPGHSLRLA
jgi:hypothetical protein